MSVWYLLLHFHETLVILEEGGGDRDLLWEGVLVALALVFR